MRSVCICCCALGVLSSLFSHTAFGERIYWSSSSPFHFYSANLDGSEFTSVFGSTAGQPISVTIDPFAEKLYYSYIGGGTRRANLDGTNSEVIRSEDLEWIKFDHHDRHFYWMKVNGNAYDLMRSDPDGRNVERVLNFAASSIWNFELDTVNSALYWAAAGTTEFSIGRIGFDGQRQTLVSGKRYSQVRLDPDGQKMYWITVDTGDRRIQRANLDGSNVEDVVVANDVRNFPGLQFVPENILIDPVNRKLLWTSRRNSDDILFRSDMDGGNIEELFDAFDIRQMVLDFKLPPGQEPLFNGHFEVPSLAGWTGTEGLTASGEFPVGSGNHVAALKPSASTSLSQSFNADSPSIRVSYAVMFLAPNSQLDVFINDTMVQSVHAAWAGRFEMQSALLPLGVTSGTGEYTIAFRHTGGLDSQVLIDNVSVQAVPEPKTTTLVAIVAVVLAGVRRVVGTKGRSDDTGVGPSPFELA